MFFPPSTYIFWGIQKAKKRGEREGRKKGGGGKKNPQIWSKYIHMPNWIKIGDRIWAVKRCKYDRRQRDVHNLKKNTFLNSEDIKTNIPKTLSILGICDNVKTNTISYWTLHFQRDLFTKLSTLIYLQVHKAWFAQIVASK